jgi:hypothetical protein
MRAWQGLGVTPALVCLGSVPLHAAPNHPTSEAIELRKPAPDVSAQPYRPRLEALIRSRYPNLLSEKLPGTAVVTVLLESDGEIAATRLDVSTEPLKELTASESQFARLGVAVGELRYVGVASIELPLNTVLVEFGARNSRNVDRALVEHFFPRVLSEGLPKGEGIWILFDHSGRVLVSGQDLMPSDVSVLLESRYPGIRISDVAANTVYGRDGRALKGADHDPLQLHCVWLGEGSPLPR